ncbi:Gamma-aminobutyric acid receptor subunit beta, partial [Hondaea fermentalgiana]
KLWEDCENKVHIDLVYVRYIAAVDTVQQTFEIAMGLEMSWRASSADRKRYEKNPYEYIPDFVPNYEFPNAKSEDRETRAHQDGSSYKIIQDENDGEYYNCMRPLVYLTCMERFELWSFPFDVQELTVTMDTPFYDMSVKKTMYVPPRGAFRIDEEASKEVKVVQDGEPLPGKLVILNRAFSAIPQFRARRVVIEFAARSDPGEEDDDDAYQYGQLVIRFQLERRFEGYLWRIAFLSILLAVTALTCFTLEVDQFAERQAMLMTLILASVAFQYVVQAELPAVPYVVLLEKLTIATFVSNILLLCLVSLVSS